MTAVQIVQLILLLMQGGAEFLARLQAMTRKAVAEGRDLTAQEIDLILQGSLDAIDDYLGG